MTMHPPIGGDNDDEDDEENKRRKTFHSSSEAKGSNGSSSNSNSAAKHDAAQLGQGSGGFTKKGNDAVEYLRKLSTVREKAHLIYQKAVQEDSLKHFTVDVSKIPETVKLIQKVTQENYPMGVESVKFHSRWRHFEPGNPDRVKEMTDAWDCDAKEKARRLIDLVIVSVLLDAGAGPSWKFQEPNTNDHYTRSEGLGIASFHMFKSGAFSLDKKENVHQVDADALCSLPDNAIAVAFQVNSEDNPLVGCQGRTELLQRLGKCLKDNISFFGSMSEDSCRPGHLVDYLETQANERNEVSIHSLWHVIMYGFQNLWPSSRTQVHGVNMGDVWTHSALGDVETDASMIPFHKLSQWLTYSLIEPLEESGLKIMGINSMTGLPEYRNGGLLIDMGVLVPKEDRIWTDVFDPSDEVIVEWRALTVALLDEIYKKFVEAVGLTTEEFPMVKMLEGGSWKAGRVLAKEKRDGLPPIHIQSDGTVF